MQDRVSEDNPYHFKAYSTRTFNFLGAFIRNGRGPGEMLYPAGQRSFDGMHLNVNDNALALAWSVNVKETVESQDVSIEKNHTLPSGTIVWLPISNSREFTLRIENDKETFQIDDRNGKATHIFDLYVGHNDRRHITHLSRRLLYNPDTEQIAEAMVFFPQINFFNIDGSCAHSTAVNKEYRKWKSVMNCRPDKAKEYYVHATSTQDYIFATYKGRLWFNQDSHVQDTHIHIFDWSGKFVYDISTNEDIDFIAFDSIGKYLYARDKTEDRIVRYDLCGLI
ncbi:MAG: BF3164 family lipoprotein [Clostridium sp.]|nr:BF3164 family lipoprotein [Clostridium sp.]